MFEINLNKIMTRNSNYAKVPGNIIFVSGMHGSGKDTLIEDFMKVTEDLPFKVIRYYKCKMTSFKINFERQPRRIAKYAIDFFRVIKLAVENPDAMIITDRCIYDAYKYLSAFNDLGWLTEDEYKWIAHIAQATFEPFKLKETMYTVLLLPTWDLIQSNLEKRQKEKGPKWHETDINYSKMVYKQYEMSNRYKGFSNTITEEDREKRVAILKDIVKERWNNFKDSIDRIHMQKKINLYQFHPSLRDDGSDGTTNNLKETNCE